MFWRVAGYSQPSPVEAILDKDQFSLEELLDEDDVIQEVKSLNSRLLDFLQQPKVVGQLVRYLVVIPCDSDDPKLQFKYPFTACEIFACEVDAVLMTLVEDSGLMGILFGFLESDPPLNLSHAGYFGRVVNALLVRRTSDFLNYIRHHEAVIEKLVHHLYNTSVTEVIIQLIGNDEQSCMYFGNHHAQWLADTSLVNQLMDQLTPGTAPEVQANATDVLAAVAQTQPSPLASVLCSSEFMEVLLNRALDPYGRRILVPVLGVCIALLDPRQSTGLCMSDCGANVSESPKCEISVEIPSRVSAASGIICKIPELVTQLKGCPGNATIDTTFGRLCPPLGIYRWKIVELFSVLSETHADGVEYALIKGHVLPLCMELFTSYPFNNVLHHVVISLINACLVGSPRMIEYLLEECQLPTWLANAPPAVSSTNGISPHRAGYMGHMTMLGNTLVSMSTTSSEVKRMLETNEHWCLFVSTMLHERNELENVLKWECGRPESLSSPGIESDPDDFQDEIGLETIAASGALPQDYFHRYGQDEDSYCDSGEDIDDDELGTGNVQHLTQNLSDLNVEVADCKTCSNGCGEKMLNHTMVDLCSISNPAEKEDGLVVVINDEDTVSLEDVNSPTDVRMEAAASKKPFVFEETMGWTPVPITRVEPEFNTFQFWKSQYVVELPDDV